jgi:ankyrin repeat protein
MDVYFPAKSPRLTLKAQAAAKASRTLLKNNLGTFLFHRANALHGAPKLLPHFIRDMTAHLMDAADEHGEQTRRDYSRALSDTMANDYDHAFYCIADNIGSTHELNNGSCFNTQDLVNRTAAAAAVGNLYLFEEAGKQDQQVLWATSAAFGHPLKVASLRGHLHIVEALVESAIAHCESNRTSFPLNQKVMIQAIGVALTRGHKAIVERLLEVYEKHIEATFNELCLKEWLPIVVRTGDYKLMRRFLAKIHPLARYSDPIYAAFALNCTTLRSLVMCRAFFEFGALELNAKRGAHRYPLHTAIKANNVKIIKQLLDLGANPNGGVQKVRNPEYDDRNPKYDYSFRLYPLDAALALVNTPRFNSKNHLQNLEDNKKAQVEARTDMFLCLLERGANPNLLNLGTLRDHIGRMREVTSRAVKSFIMAFEASLDIDDAAGWHGHG